MNWKKVTHKYNGKMYYREVPEIKNIHENMSF